MPLPCQRIGYNRPSSLIAEIERAVRFATRNPILLSASLDVELEAVAEIRMKNQQQRWESPLVRSRDSAAARGLQRNT